MKCVPVLENSYKSVKLTCKQSFVLEELQAILAKWEQQKLLDYLLHGSEQSRQYDERLELLATSQKGTDFWLSTSGYMFNPEKAQELKKAGLVGVILHLDHYDPDKHNSLHGYKHGYGWVLKAADSVRKAGLLLGLRLCISADFTQADPLVTYARMAKKMGVSVIQLADPAVTLHKQNNSVRLGREQAQILDDFAEMLNFNQQFQDWPVVSYTSALIEKLGNSSYDDLALCVDAEGKMLACPLS